ncbi:MAG: hypothetical protein KF878_20070 [Planctomycetes bacterium]|nr:hypothetical protein [Planctomycetota bacterium]
MRWTWTAVALALAACRGPEVGAYGFHERPPAATDRTPARVAPLEGATRPLAIGQVDDLTIQPVGAHHARATAIERVLPGPGVEQTYHFWAAVPALREAVRAGLVERGAVAFCDDTDLGLAAPYAGAPLPRGTLLLRGELLDFAYSREAGQDTAAAWLAWTLVDAHTGRVVWRGRHHAATRGPEAGVGTDDDPLRALGARLAAQLVADPTVRTALARPVAGGRALEAGAPRGTERDR